MMRMKYKPTNILITGGAGFIGSNFIELVLKERNYNIVNIDALTYAGNLENLDFTKNYINYRFYNQDIRNKEQVKGILASNCIDTIINFAAESHVDRSIRDVSPFLTTNVGGTINLLELSQELNIGRYIQISTDEVYGSLGPDGFFTEKSLIQPNSPYSASKAAADMFVASFYHTYNLPTLITRCSNNYGPKQFPEKLIPLMIKNALEDRPLPVYGDGLNIRDWIFVEDHNRAILKILEEGENGQVYNIGGNSEKKNIEIVELILKKLNKPIHLIKFVEDRLGHDRRYAIDSTKIREELDWRLNYNFEEGIDLTIEWYLNNQNWIYSALNKTK